jgi:hypothetical protein
MRRVISLVVLAALSTGAVSFFARMVKDSSRPSAQRLNRCCIGWILTMRDQFHWARCAAEVHG